MGRVRDKLANLRPKRKGPSTERDNILHAMDNAITQKQSLVNSERSTGKWTFEAVEKAFKQRVELDRVRYYAACSGCLQAANSCNMC